MLRLSAALMLVGLLAAAVGTAYVDRLYVTTRPAAPHRESGRVYAHHVRGRAHVYVTKAEFWAAKGVFAGGALIAILGACLFERERRKQ